MDEINIYITPLIKSVLAQGMQHGPSSKPIVLDIFRQTPCMSALGQNSSWCRLGSVAHTVCKAILEFGLGQAEKTLIYLPMKVRWRVIQLIQFILPKQIHNFVVYDLFPQPEQSLVITGREHSGSYSSCKQSLCRQIPSFDVHKIRFMSAMWT